MKRLTLKVVTLIAAAVLGASFLTSCGSPQSLQAAVEDNADVQKEIDQIAESSGMTVDIKDNVCTFTYTIDEDLSEDMIKLYADTFAGMEEDLSTQFTSIVAELEEETGIEGIQMTIICKAKSGDTVYEATFNKDGVVK